MNIRHLFLMYFSFAIIHSGKILRPFQFPQTSLLKIEPSGNYEVIPSDILLNLQKTYFPCSGVWNFEGKQFRNNCCSISRVDHEEEIAIMLFFEDENESIILAMMYKHDLPEDKKFLFNPHGRYSTSCTLSPMKSYWFEEMNKQKTVIISYGDSLHNNIENDTKADAMFSKIIINLLGDNDRVVITLSNTPQNYGHWAFRVAYNHKIRVQELASSDTELQSTETMLKIFHMIITIVMGYEVETYGAKNTLIKNLLAFHKLIIDYLKQPKKTPVSIE